MVLGITGTIGSGKGTVVEYLVKKKGFVHYSVRGFLINLLKNRKMDINRDTMASLANELRETYGKSYIIEQLAKKALKDSENCIIESIRASGEAIAIKKQPNSFLLAVDANIDLRYERILKRGSETDQIDFNTFKANENREMNSDDPNKQNLSKCIEMADYKIINNGSIELLHKNIESFLSYIKKSK